MRRFAAIPAHPQKQYTRRWRLYLFCGFYYPIREVIPIAIYHWNIGIVSRGKGKSAVAAAAYRSGEKLTNEWDGMTHDYTRKGGVVHTEIMLPPHAPPSFSDRSTLWNSVELYEKAGNAQLAREIDAALPIELSREEQIRLVREYCSSQFVSRGMCVDFVIHDTNSGNPHCHIMLTMRPLDERGAWTAKSKKEYDLDENGERIPITINAYDPEKGTVTIIVQTVGATTVKLSHMKEGDCLADFVGPLGKPTETEGKKKVAVVGGGVGCAIAYPVLKKFHDDGAEVHAIVGFRSEDLVILEEDFKKSSDKLIVCTDDGSYGRKGLVTEALKELIDAGNQYDEVFAIGPMVMMKFVSKTTEPYGIPTTVSMSPIMVDGTGMCGGCRLTVGGETKFACVDGPDFDGHKVDWDESLKRGKMYFDWERHKYEETCNLFSKEVQ